MNTLTIPFSEACERNKDAILDVIRPVLNEAQWVLEVGSGTGQHAIYFAAQYPSLRWQTSDQAVFLAGVAAQIVNADLANVEPPAELDVKQPVWFRDSRKFDVIYTANTFHIMGWSEVQAFFDGLAQVSAPSATLVVYGPFKYGGEFTSSSNESFDQNLRARGTFSGIRSFEDVNELANKAGYELVSDTAMPANNQCLIWRNLS